MEWVTLLFKEKLHVKKNQQVMSSGIEEELFCEELLLRNSQHCSLGI
jgi:hypothetical protein